MSISNISVAIIAKNAEETIQECLQSLQGFDEVILYLNDSTDNTRGIAQSFPNTKIIDGEFNGFGQTKNDAASHTNNSWILSLDSDEILNQKLINEISSLDLSDESIIYRLKRDNYFLGNKTQNSDYINRLYNKNHTTLNDNKVHEKIIVHPNSQVVTLKTSFKHLNITDINQTLTKMILYTDLGSKDKKVCFFPTIIAKAIFAFIKTYLLDGNIIRGWTGFAMAINSANRRYYKYIKQYINCQNDKTK